ncbi:S-adenosyl-L-methionine-dependent methyltransferase [Paraphoma chrysanthemicola]|uniref:S-adenosyl-L-methionine-dependent methyltransferase n=1 Tax=Paraphoma chrysanthemicola TaxID=798071 RepID=A0A8K0W2R2_9PLEO|nr:S-adenosyl-L-methionine-dependent methyltransferase [Paraphoma chrysanthemicola]
MSSSDEPHILGHAQFWDERYAKADEDKPTHEWLRGFDTLEPFLDKYLSQGSGLEGKGRRILHLGSGDSTVPYDLLERGYTNQICLDFSTVVVALMKSRHPSKPQVEWQVGDLRDMTAIASKSIDVAFDKSTMDAMIYGSPWTPPDEVLANTGKYISEVHRVLKDDGVFLCVTFRQPHFMKPIINRNNEWDLRMDEIGSGNSFQYFGFVLKKRSGTAK